MQYQVDQASWDAVAAELAAEDTSPAGAETESQTTNEAAQGEAAPAQEVATESSQEQSAAATPASTEVAKPPESAPAPSIPQELLDKLANLEGQIAKRDRDLGAAIGRVAALQREVEAAKKVTPVNNGAGPTQAQIAAASKSSEKWEAMKQDFPDWGEAIEDELNRRLSQLQPQAAPAVDVDALKQEWRYELDAQREAFAKEREELLVEIAHPKWKQRVDTPEFTTWFQAQDNTVKDLAASTSSADAIKLLDLFSAHMAKPVEEVKQDRASRLAAAATTKPGSGASTAKSVDDMSPQEYWEYLSKRKK